MAFWDPFLSLMGFGRAGRPAAPTKQVSGGGVSSFGGFVFGAERNPKLQGVTRAQTYHQAIANTDAIAIGLRALLWLVGDVEWEVEPNDYFEDQAEDDPQVPKPPGSAPSRPAPAGGGPYRSAPPAAPKMAKAFTLQAQGKPLDPEQGDLACEWVEAVLFKEMVTPFPQLVRRMATYRAHGHSVHEWVAQIRDQDHSYGLADLVEVPQTTITRWILEEGTNALLGVAQLVPQTQREVPLARSRIAYVVDDALAQGDPAGMALTRHCVEKVDQLRRFEQLEGYGYETELRGIPKAWAPLSDLKALVDNGDWTEADYNKAISHLTDFLENHIKTPSLGLLLNSEVYRDLGANSSPGSMRKWDMELLQSSGGPHGDMNTAIERKGREIARIWCAEFFYLGGGDGSHAMSSDKIKLFATLCNSTLKDIASCLERDVLKPLWKLNKFDPRTMPCLKPARVDLDDVAVIAKAMSDFSLAGLDARDPAINAFRRKLRLPPVPAEIAQAAADQAQMDAQAQLEATNAKTQVTLNPPPKPEPAGGPKPLPARAGARR